ncbi:MAG: hypothetical protein HUK02_06000 [Bacteroidaceae bacterium]|nr:hypothetical protein [Bacteroidaceae bacterium]
MNEALLHAAIAAIDAELAKEPTNALLYKERGRLRAMMGQNAEAMSDLREALRLDPSLADEVKDGLFSGNIGSCH